MLSEVWLRYMTELLIISEMALNMLLQFCTVYFYGILSVDDYKIKISITSEKH